MGDVARLPLRFKPKTIRKFEKEHGPIMDNLDINMDNLVWLVQAGNGGCDEDMAEDILETFFDSGGDVIEALVQVVESLTRGGFLPRDLGMGKVIRKQLRVQLETLVNSLEDGSILEQAQETQEEQVDQEETLTEEQRV